MLYISMILDSQRFWTDTITGYDGWSFYNG